MDETTQTIVGLAVRHFMTTLAGSLLTIGLIQAGDKGSFIQIGTEIFTGILVGAAGLFWSWWQKKGQAKVAAAADYWKEKALAAKQQPAQPVAKP